jgi:FKBP-type peptidyl-prolyl cis-trans isomerase
MADSKTKGNDAMARRDFGSAEAHYTAGITQLTAANANQAERHSTLHVLYSNRAQARLNIGKRLEDVVEDCTKAIELNPTFLKSYLRRATAHMKLGMFDEAAADLTSLKSKPAATLAQNGLDEATVQELLKEAAVGRERRAAKDAEQLGEAGLGAKWIRDVLNEDPKRRFLLPSGIACEITKAAPASALASARSPTENTNCSVHYEGSLRDGTVFDSSIQRDDPAEFSPSMVIAGWTEVLQYMVEGDVWVVHIPAEKAYGKRGAGRDIPPNATLRFEIRLEKVLDQASSKPGKAGRDKLAQAMGVTSVEQWLPTA